MRIVTYKYTGDDFHPNYKQDTVQLILLNLTNGQHRVAVWGADDCGYEKDFDSLIDARNMYFELVLLDEVNKDILKLYDFKHA